jgi:hypothetical protein
VLIRTQVERQSTSTPVVPSADTPKRKDGHEENRFSRLKRCPAPRLRVERGGCTAPAFPNAPEDDERGGGA